MNFKTYFIFITFALKMPPKTHALKRTEKMLHFLQQIFHKTQQFLKKLIPNLKTCCVLESTRSMALGKTLSIFR